MNQLLFWLLFTLGGATFVYCTYKANKDNKKDNLLLGIGNISSSLNRIYLGEFTWIILWLLGVLIFSNKLAYFLGVLPFMMLLITWGSIMLIKVTDMFRRINRNKKVKPYIDNSVKEWKKDLPKHLKINSVFSIINEHNGIMNGRLVLELSCSQKDHIDWGYHGRCLEDIINQPIMIEIKLNNESVYPK